MIEESYQFVVQGRARPQPRPRFRVLWPKEIRLNEDLLPYWGICGDCLDLGRTVALTCRRCTKKKPIIFPQGAPADDPVEVFKSEVMRVARAGYKGPLLTGPLDFLCTFIFKRPQNITWKTKPMPRRWHTSTPDFDNLAKAVSDSLTGILWKNDSYIARSTVEKFVAAGDEKPAVFFEVTRLDRKPAVSLWAEALIKNEVEW